MADDEELIDEDGDEEELNWPAIIIAFVVILGLIGAVVWYFFIREPPEVDGEPVAEYVAPEELTEESVYLDLPEMLISPADSKGRFYLIVKFDVVMNDPGAVRSEIMGKPWKLAKAKNIIIDVFSEFTREQLRSPKIKDACRARILEELNHMLGWTPSTPEMIELGEANPPPIEKLYFSTYVLQ